MQPRHVGSLVEMMMIVVLVKLAILVLPHVPTLTTSAVITFSVDLVRILCRDNIFSMFVHSNSSTHSVSISIVF